MLAGHVAPHGTVTRAPTGGLPTGASAGPRRDGFSVFGSGIPATRHVPFEALKPGRART